MAGPKILKVVGFQTPLLYSLLSLLHIFIIWLEHDDEEYPSLTGFQS
jgi:hypothetical protein